MMEKKVCALVVLAALSAAWAFEVPPVKQWPKEKIPPAHAGRILHWEGIDNVRDLGGVKTRDGRMVKRGLVYRSQAFNFNAVCSWMTATRMESGSSSSSSVSGSASMQASSRSPVPEPCTDETAMGSTSKPSS